MACRSLDALLEYLIGEVALCGSSGATFPDIRIWVVEFYTKRQNTQLSEETDYHQHPFTVDRSFLARVWRWLAKHPEVSVGQDHEFDALTLDDIEVAHPGYTRILSNDERAQSSSLVEADKVPDVNSPRMFVSEERMFHAICGHGPDPTRVFPSEFSLLCAIAATKDKGILQGELGRLTGQDKRSVPKRTDVLSAKGYIVKRSAWMGGHKTSKLFLRKFAPNQITDISNSGEATRNEPLVRDVAVQIFAALKVSPMMTQEELGRYLGLDDIERTRALPHLIRYFIRNGCLKRVRTAFGPSANAKDLKTCIHVLRKPLDSDWQKTDDGLLDFKLTFNDFMLKLQSKGSLDDAQEDGLGEEMLSFSETQDPLDRKPPCWNPDRLLPNTVFDAVSSEGTDGLTNMAARNKITGLTVRRPLEALLVRLSHRSLLSQPDEVCHLAILRTQEIADGVAIFVHKTLRAFQDEVDRGNVSWSDIVGGDKHSRRQRDIANVLHNEFGFVTRRNPGQQIADGQVTLGESIRLSRVPNISLRPGEPTLSEHGIEFSEKPQLENGEDNRNISSELQDRPISKPKRKDSTAMRPRLQKVSQSTTENRTTPRGRPRKFAQGTEKFWREMFLKAKLQADPTFPKILGSAGVMADPIGLAMYNTRPVSFDDVLLRAMSARLPLPSKPDQITQSWVDRMQFFLGRSEPGVYITPSGSFQSSRGPPSCLVVFRLSRLGELDFGDKPVTYPVHMISSSRSHTSKYLRYAPSLGVTPSQSSQPALRSVSIKNHPNSRQDKPRKLSRVLGPPRVSIPRQQEIDERALGPSLGRFYEPESQRGTGTESPVVNSPNIGYDNYIYDVGESTDATASDPDLPQRSTPRHMLASVEIDKTTGPEHRVTPESPFKTPSASISDIATNRRALKERSPSDQIKDSPLLANGRDAAVNPPDPVVELGKPNEPGHEAVHVANRSTDTTVIFPEREPVPAMQSSTQPDLIVSSVERPFSNYSRENDVVNVPVTSPTLARIELLSQKNIVQTRELSIAEAGTARFADCDEPRDVRDATLSNDVVTSSAAVPHRSESARYGDSVLNPVMYRSVSNQAKDVLEDHRHLAVTGDDQMDTVNRTSANIEDRNIHDGVKQKVTMQSLTPKKRRKTAVRKDQSDEEEHNHQRSRQPRILKGREGVNYYRQFIMELIELCSGVTPNDPSMFKRAMKTKCIEANVDYEVNAKIIKTSIKALCDRGKLKLMYFSFSRDGSMVTKTVVALPDITGLDLRYRDLQDKIKAMSSDEDYFPPELEVEAVRKPTSLARVIHPAADNLGTSTSKIRGKRQKKGLQSDGEDSITPSVSSTRSPSPPPETSLNTAFLTLRIPKIASIKTNTMFTSRFYALPPVELNVRGDQVTVNDHTSKVPNRSGRRMVQWSKQDVGLPTSLRALLSRHRRNTFTSLKDQNLQSFEARVDAVAEWERTTFEHLADPKQNEWHFINHTSKRNASTLEQLNADLDFRLVSFEADGNEKECVVGKAESWPPFEKALARLHADSVAVDGKAKRKKRKSRDTDLEEETDNFSRIRTKRRRHKRRRVASDVRSTAESEESNVPEPETLHVRKHQSWIEKHVSEDVKTRLCTAVVCVRTLVGGLERYIDWSLISPLFRQHTEVDLKAWWSVLSEMYTSDIDILTEKLQSIYLSTYNDGLAPLVDFETPKTTNWDAVVSWAMTNLDTRKISFTNALPRTRQEILATNKLEFVEGKGARDLYNLGLIFTQSKRETLFCATIYGSVWQNAGFDDSICNLMKSAAELEDSDELLSRAKSWVLATILTPQEKFDAVQAHQKLVTLAPGSEQCERLVDRGLRALQRDKVIVKQNGPKSLIDHERKAANNQSWAAGTKFFDQFDFRRIINASMLEEAARYKLHVLDLSFSRGKAVEFSKGGTLEDGQVVAILNLMDMGMIRVIPGNDIPASRYGLDWQNQGYKTKIMDKASVDFTVAAGATSTYMLGDPFDQARKRVCIPASNQNQASGTYRILPWFDIHERFQPRLWEMFLAAVLGFVSLRPGISTLEITNSLQWFLALGDVQKIIDFLLKCEAVQEVSGGYETTQWWWMAVGRGVEDGGVWKVA